MLASDYHTKRITSKGSRRVRAVLTVPKTEARRSAGAEFRKKRMRVEQRAQMQIPVNQEHSATRKTRNFSILHLVR